MTLFHSLVAPVHRGIGPPAGHPTTPAQRRLSRLTFISEYCGGSRVPISPRWTDAVPERRVLSGTSTAAEESWTGVVVIGLWTGREARALRLGLRMTIETFGEHLGVAARTVAKWEAQGSGIVPVPTIQEVLDTALERATPAQQARFQLLLGGGPAVGVRSDGRPDERGSRAPRTWGTRYEERLLLETEARQPGENHS